MDVQLARRVSELEQLVKQLLAPKSKARIIVGGGGGAELFGARMTMDWITGAATCEIYTLDGMTLTYLENASVYDPIYDFAALGDGDYLKCVKSNGKYYITDAGCPGTSPLIETPPDTIP